MVRILVGSELFLCHFCSDDFVMDLYIFPYDSFPPNKIYPILSSHHDLGCFSAHLNTICFLFN